MDDDLSIKKVGGGRDALGPVDICPRVVGATKDGKRLITCGRPLPCQEHSGFPSGGEDVKGESDG